MVTGHLHIIDWAIIIGYIAFAIGIGLHHSKKATSSVKEYFTSGQGAPWWILGTSIVATTFAADTPLAVSGLVVKRGIAGNWYWWNGLYLNHGPEGEEICRLTSSSCRRFRGLWLA